MIFYAQSQKPYWAFLLEHLFLILSFISLFFNLYFVTSVFVILEAYLKSFLKLYGVKYIFKLKSHLLIGQASSLWGCIDTYLSNGVTLTLPELHWQAIEKNLSKQARIRGCIWGMHLPKSKCFKKILNLFLLAWHP